MRLDNETGAAMNIDDIEVTRVKALDVQPGDIVAIECPQVLSTQQVTWIQALIRPYLPNDVQVIVLDSGLTIKLIRQENDHGESSKAEGEAPGRSN